MHVLVTTKSSELLLSFDHSGCDPTQDHRSALPDLHASGHKPNAAVEALNDVGGRQASLQ